MVKRFWIYAGIFLQCPLFVAVKALCQGICLDVVCQGVKGLSPDIFGKNHSLLFFSYLVIS